MLITSPPAVAILLGITRRVVIDLAKEEGIKVIGESVGGSIGRSVEFSVSSGIVTVKTKF